MADPIALGIQVPQFDLGGVLRNVAQIQHAQTANQLAQFQLQEGTERQSALSSYRGALQAGDPGALTKLAGLPDVYAQAQKNQTAQEQYRNEKAARAAMEVRDAFPEGTPERRQAYVQKLADLHQEGVVPSLAFQNLASQDPTDKFLHGIINRAMPVQAAEVPKFQKVGELTDKYGQKTENYGFVDSNRGTVKPYPAPGEGAPSASGNYGNRLEGLTGKALLEALDPGDRAQVEAIIDGRKPPPSPNARTPFTQRLAEWVAQADPGFDNTIWRTRNQTRSEFGSTKPSSAGGNLNALGTALAHGDDVLKAAKGLNNSDLPLANIARTYIGNPIARNMGGMSDFATREDKFNGAKKAYMDEVAKVFAGAQSTLADRESWEAKLTAAKSLPQLEGVVQQMTKLMKGRVEQLTGQYNSVMGTTKTPYDFMNPEAAGKMKRILGEDADLAAPGSKADHGPLPQGRAPGQQIPPAAVRFLMQNKTDQTTVQQFEEKYGRGSAQQFLTQR